VSLSCSPWYNVSMTVKKHKLNRYIAAFMIPAVMALSGCGSLESIAAGSANVESIVINEVVSSNSLSLTHETLGSPDWIELYNPTGSPVDLTGYGLSDNMKEPHKWVFPEVSIPAGGYLLVYASKYEGNVDLCTGFGLSKAGETLFLSDAYYTLLQQLAVPELSADMSYARTADGQYGYCAAPTPGGQNGDDIFLSSADAVSSAGSGAALAITEVMPENATLAAQDGRFYPWAEIRNISEAPVSLSDYYLSDTLTEPGRWRLPAGALQPGEYAMVFFSGEDSAENGELHASFGLGNDDSALMLANGAGEVISMLSWSTPMPAGLSVTGPDSYTPYPTPGADNGPPVFTGLNFASMGQEEPVRINELLKLNEYSIRDSYGDRSPWLELHNSSAQAVSLYGYFLTDDPENPFKWAFPEDSSIAPGGYMVIFLSGQSSTDTELHTSFALSRTERELMLTNSATLGQDAIELPAGIGENVSAGPDGAGGLSYYASPTPWAANSTHAVKEPSEAVITDMSGVYISEVSGVKAARSDGADWIELHNASGRDVNLEGWRLTDSANQPDKYTFASFEIPAGGYAVLSLAGDTDAGQPAPFGISPSGETIMLSDEDGNMRDVFPTGALRYGVTSGRVEGNAARVFFASATKGKANSAAYPGFTAMPVFSENTLYHDAAFELTLSCPTPGAAIYYTTDGSKPTSASSRYTGPITISQNTPVKAMAVCDGLLDSEVAAATYLFETPHTLPVVCLTIGAEDFTAVYSVEDRWQKVEREGYCEYYEADGLLGVQFPCGLRVNGASTLTYKQKSLSIFLRGGYGQSATSYQFFPGNEVTEYRSLCIRNSGQDNARARIRDSFYMRATEGLNIDNVHTKPVIVYINGQYWGLYDLNENQNEEYLATHYGIDPDTVNIIRRNETPLAGTRTDFYRVREFGLNGNTADDGEYAKFTQWVDVDYFTDYIIAQSYFANGDMFNQKYWRTTDYAIKWRPVYYDLDLAFSSSSPTRNILGQYFKPEGIPSQDGSLTNMDIYVGLRKNQGWCRQFGERYVYVVYNYFTPERLTGILDGLAAEMEPEMERHIQKWGTPSSMSLWKENVAKLRACLEQRPEYALKYLQREFGFTDAQMQEWTEKAMAGGLEVVDKE